MSPHSTSPVVAFLHADGHREHVNQRHAMTLAGMWSVGMLALGLGLGRLSKR